MSESRTVQEGLFRGIDPPLGLKYDARDADRRRAKRAAKREVRIPPVLDPDRRARCRPDLLRFLQTYLADLFPLPFSRDHLEIIADIQRVLLAGGKQAIAAARGTGKSTIVIGACVWALLFAHRRFMAILCGNHENSKARLESIRILIETNELLYEDFPEVCACVRALEGNWNRANGQTHQGSRTFMHWGGDQTLVFPTIADAPSSGAVIATRSMKTAIRGLNWTTPSGEQIRPDYVFLDDPIEAEQADSKLQVDKRETKIIADAMNLGGPDVALSAIYLGTVMRHDDLTTRFIDRHLHPDWRGKKFKLIYTMPSNMLLWQKYADLREDLLRRDLPEAYVKYWYRRHRAELDKDAEHAWPARYIKGIEISAIQHAMNLYFDEGPEIFAAEYQNEPPAENESALLVLGSYRVETKTTGLERGIIPDDALVLVSGWDVGKFGLHWATIAVAPQMLVSVIDYGVEPIDAPTGRIDPTDQRQRQALKLALTGGMRRLRDKFAEEPYCKASGEVMHPMFTLLDARYEQATVRGFCLESGPHFAPVMGCGTSMNQPKYYVPKGAKVTSDRNVYSKADDAAVWTYYAFTDSFKEAIHGGFLLDDGLPGSIATFQGEHRKTHHTFARHITAEMQTEENGLIKWKAARGRAANHWLDGFCYALAAASLLEAHVPELGFNVPRTRSGFASRPRRPRVVAAIEL